MLTLKVIAGEKPKKTYGEKEKVIAGEKTEKKLIGKTSEHL